MTRAVGRGTNLRPNMVLKLTPRPGVHPWLEATSAGELRQRDAAVTPDDLRVPPGNRLQKLSGDRAGQHSIRVDDQWRACFRRAGGLSVPPRRIDEIVLSKRAIMADTALRLARFVGTPDRFWLASSVVRQGGAHSGGVVKLRAMLRHPTAFLPLVVSAAAVITIVVHISIAGTAPQADEGAAAHLWQLLMVLELPLVALFAIRWLPEAPRQALVVLGLQLAACAAALAPVALLRW
jgi:plasmid maintenance system killer protein